MCTHICARITYPSKLCGGDQPFLVFSFVFVCSSPFFPWCLFSLFSLPCFTILYSSVFLERMFSFCFCLGEVDHGITVVSVVNRLDSHDQSMIYVDKDLFVPSVFFIPFFPSWRCLSHLKWIVCTIGHRTIAVGGYLTALCPRSRRLWPWLSCLRRGSLLLYISYTKENAIVFRVFQCTRCYVRNDDSLDGFLRVVIGWEYSSLCSDTK